MNIFSSLAKDAARGSVSIFKEDNPMGYFTKPELKETLEVFSSDVKTHYKLRNIKDAFDVMKLGVSFSRTPNHTFQNGESGTWLSFQVGKIRRNLFVPQFGDMQRLIHDYASGKFKIDKTLEEYYQEAGGE
jgi:hypothetical protein